MSRLSRPVGTDEPDEGTGMLRWLRVLQMLVPTVELSPASETLRPGNPVLQSLLISVHLGSAPVQQLALHVLEHLLHRASRGAIEAAVEASTEAAENDGIPTGGALPYLLLALGKSITLEVSAASSAAALPPIKGEDAPAHLVNEEAVATNRALLEGTRQIAAVEGGAVPKNSSSDASFPKSGSSRTGSIGMSSAFTSSETPGQWWLAGPPVPMPVATRIKRLITNLCEDSTRTTTDVASPAASSADGVAAGGGWGNALPVKIREYVTELASMDASGKGGPVASLTHAPRLWMAVGALCVIDPKTVAVMTEAAHVQRSGASLMCENHEDGVTQASLYCESCQLHLCSECDQIMHLPKPKRSHARSRLRKEDAGIGIEVDGSQVSVSVVVAAVPCARNIMPGRVRQKRLRRAAPRLAFGIANVHHALWLPSLSCVQGHGNDEGILYHARSGLWHGHAAHKRVMPKT